MDEDAAAKPKADNFQSHESNTVETKESNNCPSTCRSGPNLLWEFASLLYFSAPTTNHVSPINDLNMVNIIEENKSQGVIFGVSDNPPWHLCVILGIQHYLVMFGSTVTYPYILAPKLCMQDDDPAKGYLISTALFVSGISTLLQATFGVRLPIVEGSAFSVLVPTLAILNLPKWRCPPTNSSAQIENFTFSDSDEQDEYIETWQRRMRAVQGAIIMASLVEILIGLTGIIGFLQRWITPLVIAPTITLIGLSLFEEAADSASGQWGIAALSFILVILFSQYLKNVRLPLLVCTKENKGLRRKHFSFFALFPILTSILIVWTLCYILTATDVLPKTSKARTDVKSHIFENSPWFRFPYPGQWGLPTVSVSATFGILAGILASSVDSIGDYYACARLSGAPPPPTHAINRGIFIEGVTCVLSGLWGSGSALTCYCENVGVIGITKVASRRVVQIGGLIMIFFGILGKFGALFITIPEPIIGGVCCIVFAMVAALGISHLQYVDLNSMRNLFIFGVSLFMGLLIPHWIRNHPEAINTGNKSLDHIIIVLLSTHTFVGGFIGFIFDNTIPGSIEERGLIKYKAYHYADASEVQDRIKEEDLSKCYDVPFGMSITRKFSIFKYIPISPTYDEEKLFSNIRKLFNRKKAKPHDVNEAEHISSTLM